MGQKFKTLTNLDFEIIEVKPTVKIKNSQNSIVPLSKESILSYLKQKDFNTTRGHFSYQPVIAKYIYDKLNSKTDFATKIEQYRKLLDDKSITLNTITEQPFNIYKSKRGITTDTNHSFSIEKLIEINNGILTNNPDGTYGKFIVEDINKRFPTANKKNQKNYILIIDEINRGNISKIFGELITLIEPSKRIGATEEIKVKLPNNGELFGVPQNLYIIGTMNTADRSIAQIDTALRRRFEFVEMLPKPELLVDKNKNPIIIDGINVQKILEAINERIEYIHDREHTIGHSYFMPLKDEPTKAKLDEIFRVNIIPLLTEYFYSDWQDLRFVLNNDYIKEKSNPKYIQNSNN